MDKMPVLHYAISTKKLGADSYLVKGGEAWKLNEVGEKVILLLTGSNTLEQIAASIAKEYGVDVEMVLNDCQEMMEDFEKQGLIEYV